MMKATEATTRTRRRCRHHCATSGPPIIATYYNFFVVSVIYFGHQGVIGGTLCRFPVVVVAESLRYHHGGQSDPLFRSSGSIVFDGIIRCDAEDYGDGIDIIRTESLIAPSSRTDDATPPTPLASYYHGRRRAATTSGRRPRDERIIIPPFRGGGARDGKGEDDERRGPPANNSESHGEDADNARAASAASSSSRDDGRSDRGPNHRPISDPSDDAGIIPHQIHRAYYSFLSWFRGVPAEGSSGADRDDDDDEDDSRRAAADDVACIAHKMPHGPDGRGGGGGSSAAVVGVAPPPPPRRGVLEGSDERRARAKEFAITTAEVAAEVVVTNEDALADVVSELESGKLAPPEMPPSAGTRTSTAFAVPPTRYSPLSSADTGKGYVDVKESKSSKIKLAVGEVYEEAHATTVSLNSTRRNETEMILLSNATLNGNATEPIITVSDATTAVGQNSYDLELLIPKDYTSSGYVSFLTLFLFDACILFAYIALCITTIHPLYTHLPFKLYFC